FGDARGQLVAGIGELGADGEQVALNLHERRVQLAVGERRSREAEPGVQLVDVAVRVDPRIVFLHAGAVEERSLPGVARSRVDFHVGPDYTMGVSGTRKKDAKQALPAPPARRRFRDRKSTR